jgi:uncharacterized protein YggE
MLLVSALAGSAFLQPWAPALSSADDREAVGQRLITVNGHAEIRVVPDEVILTVGVETFDLDLDVAKTDNDLRMNGILQATRDFGIRREHVRTDYFSIEPRYEDRRERKEFLGYLVRKTAVITVRDVTEFEALLSSVLEAGANYVHGVDFRTTELRKHRDEARALAVDAAREKAEAMARQLGQEVGAPHAVQEGHSGWWSSYGWWWGPRWRGGMAQNVIQNLGGASEEMEGPTMPGQIAITARVTVTFELLES